MTAYGCIELAVQAIKAGAYDFITKPFDHDNPVLTLRKAMERSRLLRENLREDIPPLMEHFLSKRCAELGKPPKTVSTELMDLFPKHPWEGNVRQIG